MKTGHLTDHLSVEEGRPMGLMSEHTIHMLVNSVDARGGSHVHAKRLQDPKGVEVRCRLVTTHQAIGERLDVTQSTPQLMLARLLLAITSAH